MPRQLRRQHRCAHSNATPLRHNGGQAAARQSPTKHSPVAPRWPRSRDASHGAGSTISDGKNKKRRKGVDEIWSCTLGYIGHDEFARWPRGALWPLHALAIPSPAPPPTPSPVGRKHPPTNGNVRPSLVSSVYGFVRSFVFPLSRSSFAPETAVGSKTRPL